ncbi:histidine phosphatase family protein [Leifsonia sp. P73]|uniref:histidine phosphatase family protein n=1 Tax=Leifsonia sp. P73 TaxID=3423959 RepID=UPI003DA65EDB
MRLLLLRHGQTPDNVQGILGTMVPGPTLTSLGKRQAAALPASITEPIAAIAVSTMVRTQLTAAPFAADRGLQPTVFDGLREVEAGTYEGRNDRASVAAYLRTFCSWAAGDLDVRNPGAENGHDFFARYDAALAAASAPIPAGGTLAVVSHGAAIRAWVGLRSSNTSATFTLDRPLENTGLAELEGDSRSGWTLLSWQGEPVGGPQLEDRTVADPIGHEI